MWREARHEKLSTTLIESEEEDGGASANDANAISEVAGAKKK
jgi:hypothetical protein